MKTKKLSYGAEGSLNIGKERFSFDVMSADQDNHNAYLILRSTEQIRPGITLELTTKKQIKDLTNFLKAVAKHVGNLKIKK